MRILSHEHRWVCPGLCHQKPSFLLYHSPAPSTGSASWARWLVQPHMHLSGKEDRESGTGCLLSKDLLTPELAHPTYVYPHGLAFSQTILLTASKVENNLYSASLCAQLTSEEKVGKMGQVVFIPVPWQHLH